MKKRLALFAAAALLLTACAAPLPEEAAGGYEVYYEAYPAVSDGADAIRALRVDAGEQTDTEAVAGALVEALLSAPEDASLRSAFPAGTTLQKVTIAGGRATVDLSAQYARLSGVDLSIADYCLTLTLTQLPGVYAVRITANGRELPYRETQLLTAADALLSSGEETLRPINVSLWFWDGEKGELRAQQRTLALYEGQTRVSAVIDALLRGPEDDPALRPLLPEGFGVLSSRIDEGTCYVNLSSRAPLPKDEAQRALALDSLARSILSLGGVEQVQFLVDGEPTPQPDEQTFAPETETAQEP